MEFKALFVLVLIILFSCTPINAIEINPSVESQPFFCRYSITERTPLCSHGAGTPGKAGAAGTGNNTFLYNSTTNETTTYSNTTNFFNTTIGNNITTISNYTYFTLINVTYSEMNQTPGPQGPQGIQGIPGPEGPMNQTFNLTPNMTTNMTVNMTPNMTAGPKGDKGEKGDIGLTGATGPPGADGAANMTAGPQGIQGVNGTPGYDGAQGIQGIQGIQGVNGTPGIQGPQGEKGDKGDQGEPGAANMTAGPPGAANMTAGPAGATGAAGLDANVSTMYPVGSVYITTTTTSPATLLGAGTWASIQNISSTTVYSRFNAVMTSNTAPASNTTLANANYAGEDPWKGADSDNTGTWWSSGNTGSPWWWQTNTTNTFTLTNYTIYPRSGFDVPKTWKLNASTDGTIWTTIDTQTNIAFSGSTPQSFVVSNSNAYNYYRIVVTVNSGGGASCSISSVILYKTDSSTRPYYYWERTA